MIAKLEFNLPEENEEMEIALNGWKWRSLVRDLMEEINASLDVDNGDAKTLNQIRGWIIQEMNEERLDY